MTYRRLNDNDLRTLYNLLRAKYDSSEPRWIDIRAYVRTYYPQNATSAVIVVASQYNDQDYDNEIRYIDVFDANGDELTPLKEKRDKARIALESLSLPDEMDTTNDELDDITIFLGEQQIPALYVPDNAETVL
jgi:hypothetical protein